MSIIALSSTRDSVPSPARTPLHISLYPRDAIKSLPGTYPGIYTAPIEHCRRATRPDPVTIPIVLTRRHLSRLYLCVAPTDTKSKVGINSGGWKAEGGGVQAARQKARPDERPPIYRVVARGAINSRGFTAARKRAPLYFPARARASPKICGSRRDNSGSRSRIPVQEHPALVIRNISADRNGRRLLRSCREIPPGDFSLFPRDPIFFLAVNWLYGPPVRYGLRPDCWPNVYVQLAIARCPLCTRTVCFNSPRTMSRMSFESRTQLAGRRTATRTR